MSFEAIHKIELGVFFTTTQLLEYMLQSIGLIKITL